MINISSDSSKTASLIADNIFENSIFKQTHRDNCKYPFWLLREKFKARGISLNTADLNKNKKILFELHLNARIMKTDLPSYLFLWENSAIIPKNELEALRNKYRRIFTWDDQLVDGNRYVKFYLPVYRHPSPFSFLGWEGRNKFSCLIAVNKNVIKNDAFELYSKRIDTIRWFECNAPSSFDLFGIGWDRRISRSRFLNKIYSCFPKRFIGVDRSPSYRGPIENKHNVLLKYRFSICYENMSELPGYITEKIFDCFFAGCVPIYWGAKNILDYVPKECFIDRREFTDHESLFKFMSSMSENDYIAYQRAIQKFLMSETAKLFYSDNFVSNVVGVIMSDLEEVV